MAIVAVLRTPARKRVAGYTQRRQARALITLWGYLLAHADEAGSFAIPLARLAEWLDLAPSTTLDRMRDMKFRKVCDWARRDGVFYGTVIPLNSQRAWKPRL